MDQKDWKLAANTYCKHNGPNINRDHLDIVWPIPIASSKVDAYHHGYFIRAVLASILYPKDGLLQEDFVCLPIASVESDEIMRREHQIIVYTKLCDMLPNQPAVTPNRSITDVYQMFTEIRQVINEQSTQIAGLCSMVEDIRSRFSLEVESVDKGPNRRRKLPAKA
jgi:hypothetical protein